MRQLEACTVAVLLLAVGCPAGPGVGPDDCATGERPHPAYETCVPLRPSAPCGPGTMPVLGLGDCQPVGWTDCSAGFEQDGEACGPVLPSEACTGATRRALGSTECVPVGDCTATFPPPEATFFVDDDLDPAQVDATHFRSIADAVEAAPPQTVIAVEAGRYARSLGVYRALTVVGRCAAEVELVADGQGFVGAGAVGVAADLTLSGITLRGHVGGLVALDGGRLVAREVVVESTEGAGVQAQGVGSRMELRDAVIRTTRVQPALMTGVGVMVDAGATGIVSDLEVSDTLGYGVLVRGEGATLDLQRAVVSAVATQAGGISGYGMAVIEGGRLNAGSTVVEDADQNGVTLAHPGSDGELEALVVRRTSVGDPTRFDTNALVGVRVADGASLALTRARLDDNPVGAFQVTEATAQLTEVTVIGGGRGGAVDRGATATLRSVAFVRNQQVSFTVARMDHARSPAVEAERLLVRDGQPDASGRARSVSVEGATLQLSDGALLGAREVALMVALSGGVAVLDRVLVDRTVAASPGVFGHGLLAQLDGRLDVLDSVVEASEGIGLAVSGGTGRVSASFFVENAVGVHAQSGTSLSEVATLPEPAVEGLLAVTEDTRFLGNGARVGSGAVPLPELIESGN